MVNDAAIYVQSLNFVIIITFPYFSPVLNVFGSKNKFDTERVEEY